jgi:TRAP-type mannitol/chloroaromatic compound transport system substrate-binding protein
MNRLGATTVVMPGSAVAAAFNKHEIDAAELLTPAADKNLGLVDHVKLIYVPGWHQPETVLELLINQKRWDGLDPTQQGQIETTCRTLLTNTAADSATLQKQALADLAAKGVRIETWPDAMLQAFRGAWDQVAKEEGDRDLFFSVVIGDLDKFRGLTAAAPATVPAMPPLPPPSP